MLNKVFKAPTSWGFDDFLDYLKLQGVKQAQSRTDHLDNLKRFFNLLTWSPETDEPIAIMVDIHRTDLLVHLFDQPLLSLKYTWSRNIINALHYFVGYLVRVCSKRDPEWVNCRLPSDLKFQRGGLRFRGAGVSVDGFAMAVDPLRSQLPGTQDWLQI